MIQVKTFPVNHFAVNTYVLWDETNECVLVDVACTEIQEEQKIEKFIAENNLKPVAILLTHAHIDHIVGISFATETYHLPITMHKAGLPFFEGAAEYGKTMGFLLDQQHLNAVEKKFIDEGDVIKFGNSQLTVRYTPGHADGSVCFVSSTPDFVITGDVLFKQSIGRTDLPTGDYDLLIENIKNKILTLPEETAVYPGHGPATLLSLEKYQNHFLFGLTDESI